jgi:hypothetical protein
MSEDELAARRARKPIDPLLAQAQALAASKRNHPSNPVRGDEEPEGKSTHLRSADGSEGRRGAS